MNKETISAIWHIRGSLPLPPDQSSDEAFRRLAPLFRETGTSYERHRDTLTFSKHDPAAQDKMAVFDNGVLHVRHDAGRPVLHYHLISRALLLCFLAPLLFLAFAGGTVLLGKYEAAKAAAAPKKPEKKDKVLPQSPIDKALGAPAPEPPKKDKKSDDDKKPSPTSAYVFAGLFAFLYVAGRIIEQRQINRTFERRLSEA